MRTHRYAQGMERDDADLQETPRPSLAERLGSRLAPLRRRVSAQHLVLAWAAGASLLALGLALERRSPPPASEAAVPPWPQPAHPMAATPDLAPALPPGLAGAPPPLVGIVGRLPDDAVALIRIPSGRTRTLAVGAVFDGWTLASLDAEEAVFARHGQRVTMTLPLPADQ